MKEKIIKIWQDVLCIGSLPANSSFFDIGGDSISAILLVSRIQQEFNIDLPLHFLFENPTIDSMYLFIHNIKGQ